MKQNHIAKKNIYCMIMASAVILASTPAVVAGDVAQEYEAAYFLEIGQNKPHEAIQAYERLVKIYADSQDEATKDFVAKCLRRIDRVKARLAGDSIDLIKAHPSKKTFVQTQRVKMQKYLWDTREMVKQKQYSEALERYRWFHDHVLEQSPSLGWLRLSSALKDWKRLADVHPPARQALQEVRNKKTLRLENGTATPSLFHDVAAINKVLGEEQKTIKLFRVLDQRHPEMAQQCWSTIYKPMIDRAELELVKKYMPDPMVYFEKNKSLHQKRRKSKKVDTTILTEFNNWLIEDSRRLIYAALATGKEEIALEIQRQTLAMLDDPRLAHAVEETREAIRTGSRGEKKRPGNPGRNRVDQIQSEL